MKTYMKTMDNLHSDWLCFMADLETGQLDAEPHESLRIVSRDLVQCGPLLCSPELAAELTAEEAA